VKIKIKTLSLGEARNVVFPDIEFSACELTLACALTTYLPYSQNKPPSQSHFLSTIPQSVLSIPPEINGIQIN
jgi:hypothetical protein